MWKNHRKQPRERQALLSERVYLLDTQLPEVCVLSAARQPPVPAPRCCFPLGEKQKPLMTHILSIHMIR